MRIAPPIRVLFVGLFGLSLPSCGQLLGLPTGSGGGGGDAGAVDAAMLGAADGSVDGRVGGAVDASAPGPDGSTSSLDAAVDAPAIHDANIGSSETGATCGGGTTACQGTCVTGTDMSRCMVMISAAAPQPYDLAVGGGAVYFSSWQSQYLKSVPAVGGATSTLVAPAMGLGVSAIALDDASVFFTVQGQGGEASGSILQMPLGGGSTTTVATGLYAPIELALDSTNVYWAETGGALPVDAGSEFTAPKSGAGPIKALGWDRQSIPGGVAVDSAYLYCSNTDSQSMTKTPKGGGSPVVTLTSGSYLDHPLGIAVNASGIFWASGGAGWMGEVSGLSLGGALLDGGSFNPAVNAGAEHIVEGVSGPAGTAIDSDSFYWTTSYGGSGTVVKYVIATNRVVTMASLPSQGPVAIAVDSTSVYWLDANGGGVWKMTPK